MLGESINFEGELINYMVNDTYVTSDKTWL